MMNKNIYVPNLSEAALQAALDTLHESWPGCQVYALLPEAEKDRVPLLQAVCRDRGVALHGALFPALIVEDGFPGAGVWLLPLDAGVPVFLLDGMDRPEAQSRLNEAVAGGVRSLPQGSGDMLLFLMFDATLANIHGLLKGVYERFRDDVRYAGVGVGSETFQPVPCLFDSKRFIVGGVMGVVLPEHEDAVLEHGFVAPAKVVIATSTRANQVIQIDQRPAFQVYSELLQTQYGIELSPDNFYTHATRFPFGILHGNQEMMVRIPVGFEADGTLHCVGEVPSNSLLVVLKAQETVDTEAIDRMVRALPGPMAEGQEGLLTFYCAGRRMQLGDAAREEVQALRMKTGVTAMPGALSLGEVGSVRGLGYPFFHNATLVSLHWG